MKNIFLSSDHAGELLATEIQAYLKKSGFNPILLTRESEEDYTDVAKKVSNKVLENQNSIGILICGSGVGVSITCNRFKGIRGALCHSVEIAKLCRLHNDANILCLGARIVDLKSQLEIVECFLNTEFDGGRHEVRIKKIDNPFV